MNELQRRAKAREEDDEALRAMRAIVDYDWATEARDYEDQDPENREGHVFERLREVDDYLTQRGY